MFAKFYEIPSLPFQDIEKPNCCRRTDKWMDGQCENSIPPTNTVCGGYNDKTINHTPLNLNNKWYHPMQGQMNPRLNHKSVIVLILSFFYKWVWANSVDPYQKEQSDQGLHCLPFHLYSIFWTHYSIVKTTMSKF